MNLNAKSWFDKEKIQFALPYTTHKCLFSQLHLAQLPCVVRAREHQTHVWLWFGWAISSVWLTQMQRSSATSFGRGEGLSLQQPLVVYFNLNTFVHFNTFIIHAVCPLRTISDAVLGMGVGWRDIFLLWMKTEMYVIDLIWSLSKAGLCNETGKDLCSEASTGQCHETSTALCSEVSTGLCHETSTGLCNEASTGLCCEASTGLGREASTGLCSEASTGLCNKTYTGLCHETNTGLCSGTHAGLSNETSTGLCNETSTGLCQETSAGLCHDASAGLCRETSTVKPVRHNYLSLLGWCHCRRWLFSFPCGRICRSVRAKWASTRRETERAPTLSSWMQ